MRYFVVLDPEGYPVERTLCKTRDKAIRAAETDLGGLDAAWKELEAEGYSVYEVKLEVVR